MGDNPLRNSGQGGSADPPDPPLSPCHTPKSKSKTVIVKGTHSLSVQGFSFTKSIGVGEVISSDTFLVGGHSWRIRFYPNGEKKDEQNGKVYVRLFIELVSKSEGGVEAYTEHALLDQSGNKWSWKSLHNFSMGSDLNGPERITTTWGYKEFYERAKLEASSQFIKDDCLTVQCTVGVVKTIMDVGASKPVSQMSELGKCYGKLLESKEGSDITFEVEGETFYAHRLVLSTRSPVFRAQFFGPLKEENTQCIKIEEMQAPIFKALLHFIYCDVMADVGEELEAAMMAQHLLAAADRYGIERLKTICESTLCENIVVNTVASTLVLAEKHGCSQLKSMCLEFIGMPKNIKAVMETDGYKNLKESFPSVIDEFIKSLVRCTYVAYMGKEEKVIPTERD